MLTNNATMGLEIDGFIDYWMITFGLLSWETALIK